MLLTIEVQGMWFGHSNTDGGQELLVRNYDGYLSLCHDKTTPTNVKIKDPDKKPRTSVKGCACTRFHDGHCEMLRWQMAKASQLDDAHAEAIKLAIQKASEQMRKAILEAKELSLIHI